MNYYSIYSLEIKLNCQMNFTEENQDIVTQKIAEEQQPDYERAERNLLIDALKRTHKERFLVATRLYKIQQMLSKAIITHKP